jgi:hypothetical protein
LLLLFLQNLIATKLGVQKITGITVFDKSEKKTYAPLPDLEVSYACQFAVFLVTTSILNIL